MAIDIYHLASQLPGNLQVFTAPDNANDVSGVTYQTWTKPSGMSMAYMLCIGSGGQGAASGGGSHNNGGGGGGSGSQSVLLCPIFLLPDTLSIKVGLSTTANGANGGGSAIYLTSSMEHFSVNGGPAVTDTVLSSGGGGAGNNGDNGSPLGQGGAAGSALNAGSCNYVGLGIAAFIAGQAGANGGLATTGNNQTIPTTGLMCTGGASGSGYNGSTATAGGGFTSIANSLISQAAPSVTVANGGSDGPHLPMPFFSFGGCGGSISANGGVCQAGGGGLFGAGGGGGAGSTVGSSPNNGRPGDGLVIIYCW